MTLPPGYTAFLASSPTFEVNYGIGGLEVFAESTLEDRQLGYSVAPDGRSLCGPAQGEWHPAWIVIGQETACGDPTFVDIASANVPVLTAMHGEGSWDPTLIAISLDAFAQCVKEFAAIAQGRANPVTAEANPITAVERA
jgi:hypothetical protein